MFDGLKPNPTGTVTLLALLLASAIPSAANQNETGVSALSSCLILLPKIMLGKLVFLRLDFLFQENRTMT